jgi:hypothetical protein
MQKSAMIVAATALGAATAFVSRPAQALGPVDLEVAAKAGGATNPFGGSGPNPLGFGLGARGGVSFLGIYGGLAAMYYFGSSQDLALPGLPVVHISEAAFMYGVEGGYGGKLLELLTVRLQLGVGNFQFNQSGPVSGGSNLYLEPGATAFATLGTLLVGADANVLLLPSIADPSSGNTSTRAGFTAHAQVGLKF